MLKGGRKSKEAKRGKPESELESQPSKMVFKDIKPELFPEPNPFPEEGILGMYPIQSACKREVAEHMLRFQQRLQEEYYPPPKLTAKIIDYRHPNSLSQAYDRVLGEMEMFQSEIEELKHMLAVDAIKKKYQEHEPWCPCADNNN